jgi:DNA-binding NarL/FixJ family response regulator
MTSNESKIRVLICSKYTLFREGLKALLQHADLIVVIGEAATAKQALRLAEQLHPHVLLLQPTPAGLNGSEVTRRIKALNPQVQVLVLSFQDDEHLVADCLTAGAAGYLRKSVQPEQLKSAIYEAFRSVAYAA